MLVRPLIQEYFSGVGPFEVKLVLAQLVADRILTLPIINERIVGFACGRTEPKIGQALFQI